MTAILSPEVENMNLTEIGKFIAELRKEQGLTQEQLGEMLGVSNKTVSRWETGIYLPPADALLAMSRLFDLSINEILTGRRLPAEEYKETAEQNLAQTIRVSSFSLQEKIAFFKKKWLREHIAAMVLWGIIILAALIFAILAKNPFGIVAAWVLYIIAHVWRNNTMMAYVERRAFDPDD